MDWIDLAEERDQRTLISTFRFSVVLFSEGSFLLA
jgi:hypothetical protein